MLQPAVTSGLGMLATHSILIPVADHPSPERGCTSSHISPLISGLNPERVGRSPAEGFYQSVLHQKINNSKSIKYGKTRK
jgi:hypothetical protein